MKTLKFFIIFLFLFGTAVMIFPSEAEWMPPGITINPATVVEGTTIEISATFKVMKNIRGLEYRAGIDMKVIRRQNLPGVVVKDNEITVAFKWKAVRGRHNIFYRLIIPTDGPKPLIKKLNQTVRVAPRILPPGQHNNISSPAVNTTDMCGANLTGEAMLEIKSLSAHYEAVTNTVVYSMRVRNNGLRCLRRFIKNVQILYASSDRQGPVDKEFAEPDKAGGWAIRGLQTRTIMGSFSPPRHYLEPPHSVYCGGNQGDICAVFKFQVLLGSGIPGKSDSKTIIVNVGPVQE